MMGSLEQAMGRLEQAGPAWRLRFTRELAHPVDRVWRAVTETEHLTAWFPLRITGDWVVGGSLTFADPGGRGPEFAGQVLAYQPPSVLEFSWGPDVLRLELRRRGAGTTLTLLDTFGELGQAARDAAGWHVCLDLLAGHLDGSGTAVTWTEVHPGYVAAFGPAASTVGPPAGYEPAG
ncbi:MAG TPA: SRPBCC family protein [Streptosporangiaceae bacterium]|nr:SRPBCC family protein [Streptosporangiaceae bacterium]